jgi:chromosome segregation ATPase
MNKYLENEIKIQKEHNNDLVRTNDKLIEENNNLNDKLIHDTNELNDLIQEKDAKKKEYEERQKNLELNNDKMNKDYDELLNINNKAKNDYNILSQNYDELNNKNNNTRNELCLLKDLENKHFSDIEDKMNSIIQKIEELKKEQNDLNKKNNENKNKLDKIKKDKDELYNKYQQEMILSDKLNKDLYNNKLNLNAIKSKCQEQKENRNKKVKTRPSSINKKKALIKDLQKKIDDYKIKTLRNSSINDDY